jgi:hypothetical protein
VRKSQFPWAIVIILVIGYALGSILGLVLAALGLLVVYISSLRLHPRTRHRACGGTGEHHSALFPWTHRKCPGCGGRGRIIRWGASQWGAGHIQAEHREAKEARAAAKENRAWR